MMVSKLSRITRNVLERFSPRLLIKIRIFLKQGYESELKLVPFLCDKNEISIDVGAHWGLYTSLMSKYSKMCWAFEPIPQLSYLLKRTFGSKVIVEPVALSNKVGESELKIPIKVLGKSTLEQREISNSEQFKIISVPVKKLDDYKFDKISLIKIDVEGHEEEVLKGAEKTLMLYKPSLIIEAEERHKPNAVQKITKYLNNLGYKGFFFFNGSLQNIENFKLEYQLNWKNDIGRRKKIVHENYVNNFIFIIPDKMYKLSQFFPDLVL